MIYWVLKLKNICLQYINQYLIWVLFIKSFYSIRVLYRIYLIIYEVNVCNNYGIILNYNFDNMLFKYIVYYILFKVLNCIYYIIRHGIYINCEWKKL